MPTAFSGKIQYIRPSPLGPGRFRVHVHFFAEVTDAGGVVLRVHRHGEDMEYDLPMPGSPAFSTPPTKAEVMAELKKIAQHWKLQIQAESAASPAPPFAVDPDASVPLVGV